MQSFPEGKFFVLLYPGESRRIFPFLEKLGISYWDYSSLFDPATDMELVLHKLDVHPSARAIERVSRKLIEDIKAVDL